MDLADYRVTGRPFPYGPGRPMAGEERAFLKGLMDMYWKPMVMDFGRTGRYPEGTLTHAEVDRSPENLTLLDYYGIDRPEPRDAYDY
jgi:hypothetical protein